MRVNATVSKKASEPQQFEYIDALRGLAIMGVVLVHVAQRFEGFVPPLSNLLNASARGVQLFFVASALTLTHSWSKRNDGVVKFYIRRIFRIAPLFWTAMAFYSTTDNRWSDWSDIFVSGLFINGLHPAWLWSSPVPGAWSIATEMAFYLIFPILAALITSYKRAIALLVLFAIVDRALSPEWVIAWSSLLGVPNRQNVFDTAWLWLPAEMPVFLAGMSVYYVMKSWNFSKVVANVIGATSIISALTLSMTSYGMAEWGVVFAMLAISLGSGGMRFLNNRVVRELGLVSFGIYLVHFAVIDVLSRSVEMSFSDPWNLLLAYPVTIGISYAISLVLSVLIESPGRRLGRLLIERIYANAPGPTR